MFLPTTYAISSVNTTRKMTNFNMTIPLLPLFIITSDIVNLFCGCKERIYLGYDNKSIARRLEISDKTVEAHRAKVMSKMQASSLAELVKMVLSLERE